MSGLQQNFLSALNQSFQFGQNIKANRDRNQLAQLSSQAYSAAPEQRQQIYGQMAAINQQAAQQQEQAFASSDDRRNQSLANAARLLMSAPEQYRPGIYQQMRTGLSNFIPNLPEQYDQSVAQAAQSIAQAYGNLDKQTPTDVRSFQMMTAGLSAEDREKARRVQLGLDGRASSSGFTQVKVTGADGRERIGVLNGRTGQIDLPDGTSFNPNTGAITPTQGGQVLPQGGGQQVLDQDAALANQMIAAGIPEANVDAFLAQRAASFGGGQPQMVAPSQNPSAFVGRTPEEQAAATEAAKLDVQQQYLPQELSARTDAAIRQAAGAEFAKGQAQNQLEAIQNLPRVMQESTSAISLINKALNHPGLATAVGASGRFDPRNYFPGSDAVDFRVLLDQIKGGAFLQAFERLKGGGAITEMEGQKAEQAIARLNRDQSETAFRESMNDLKEVAQTAITRAQTKAAMAGQQQSGGAQAPQSGSQRTVTRRGRTPDGRTVVQYSDGAIEYGN